ncbi:cupin domain-containing protein, partial [bacterium M00.F.Ca.ET.229.01.1.1]
MRNITASALLLASAFFTTSVSALDSSNTPVVVTPLASKTTTASGQPITLPPKNVEVQVSAYEIAPGATLPVHKHPFPRYAYVEAGTLKVTNVETGNSNTYKTGDFIVETIGQWHQ